MAVVEKLEIELRMYWVKKNPKQKWWAFWQPKEIRVLSELDSAEAAIEAFDKNDETTNNKNEGTKR